MARCLYEPFIADVDSPLTPPSATVPTYVRQGTVQFDVGGDVLTLRTPRLEDTESLNFRRISHRNLNGKIIIAGGQSWRKDHLFNFVIESSCDPDFRQNTLTWLTSYAGQVATFTDHWGRQFEGVIRVLSMPIAQRASRIFQIQFDFEGRPV